MISIMIPTVGPQIQIIHMYFITLWSNWEVYLFPVVSRSCASGTWITLLVLSCLSAWRVLGITWHPVYVMQAWMYACVCVHINYKMWGKYEVPYYKNIFLKWWSVMWLYVSFWLWWNFIYSQHLYLTLVYLRKCISRKCVWRLQWIKYWTTSPFKNVYIYFFLCCGFPVQSCVFCQAWQIFF